MIVNPETPVEQQSAVRPQEAVPRRPVVAYFSMEVGLRAEMPTYSGGLGVLAGDTLRSAADLRVPMVAVTLLHRRGYLRQRLDSDGLQHEEPSEWRVEDFLEEQPARTTVVIEGREVHLRAWRLELTGATGGRVPAFFLDTDLPENSEYDRRLTDHLYGGDERYRLCQEVVLGMGGVRMLRALGYGEEINRYHMNEGHAALLGLELLEERARNAGRSQVTQEDVEAVRAKCVFTTHTPVPAGHDQFPQSLVRRVLGDHDERLKQIDWRSVVYVNGKFNMTYMALSLSRYVNGVAKRHAEISQLMFANYVIEAITNGVHAATWVSPPMAALFDRRLKQWRRDSFDLRYVGGLPREDVRQAHVEAKQALLSEVEARTGARMAPETFTLGFARRATAYKRADLLFHDTHRLQRIAETNGPMQIIYAGKAHPRDADGKRMIQRIVELSRQLGGPLRLVYLENYDMALAKLLVSGVDVWLNTPRPPQEASGTSGMKAALNGVPSLSVLDGWWIEGAVEGITGWSIGPPPSEQVEGAHADAADAADLYRKLEEKILPLYYGNPAGFADVMRHAIAVNGSFFNTQRMVQQYVLEAYFR
jgi:starch phosphorylase